MTYALRRDSTPMPPLDSLACKLCRRDARLGDDCQRQAHADCALAVLERLRDHADRLKSFIAAVAKILRKRRGLYLDRPDIELCGAVFEQGGSASKAYKMIMERTDG